MAAHPPARPFPARVRRAVARAYADACGLAVRWLDTEARPRPPAPTDPLSLPALHQAARDALGEATRWGEPYVFFLAPGLLSWIVPLVDGELLLGAAGGGEVLADETDRAEARAALCAAGWSRARAQRYVRQLPVWSREQPRAAAQQLYDLCYQHSDWKPVRLLRQRAQAEQQREIAQTIHTLKLNPRHPYPFDQERLLLSLIRVGDKKGARRVLNELLAAQFLHAPSVPVLRARAIELMGYLVRAAVEDNPQLEPLIARNHVWLMHIVAAPDFDAICTAQRDALDAFVEAVAVQGFNRSNPAVGRALDYIAAHFREPLGLAEVARAAGLSTYRLAHLVKTCTGHTIMQHVKRLRLQFAQKLLDEGLLNGAAIALEAGFHDQSHLTRQFRAVLGTTPGRYRRRART